MRRNLSILLFFFITIPTLSQSCYQGQYFSVQTQTCQQCHLSCATCNQKSGCLACYTQMYQKSPGSICQLCYEIQPQCDNCLSATQCKICINGYVVDRNNGNTCKICDYFIPYCQFCRQNNGSLTCITCQSTHSLEKTGCVPKDPNFVDTKNRSNTISNNNGTQNNTKELDNKNNSSASANNQGSQTNSNNVNQPQNQLTQQTQQTQTKPVVQSTTVQPIIPASIPPSSSIPTTNPPKSPQLSGIMTDIPQCLASEVRVSDMCIPKVQFCDNYDKDSKKCTKCQQGFYLNFEKTTEKCIPNLLASQLNFHPNLITQPIPSSTSSASSSPGQTDPSSCLPQKLQYYWAGRCITYGSQCSSKESNGKCKQCIDGFDLDTINGVCIKTLSSSQVSGNNQNQQDNNQLSSSNSQTVTAFVDISLVPSSSICNAAKNCRSCLISNPDYCLSCNDNFTTVDRIPGLCFPLF